MIKQVIKKTIDLGDGRTITIETGKLAKQADGAVEVRMGNTMLLATVCSAQEAGEGVDFMPLLSAVSPEVSPIEKAVLRITKYLLPA